MIILLSFNIGKESTLELENVFILIVNFEYITDSIFLTFLKLWKMSLVLWVANWNMQPKRKRDCPKKRILRLDITTPSPQPIKLKYPVGTRKQYQTQYMILLYLIKRRTLSVKTLLSSWVFIHCFMLTYHGLLFWGT